jgi:hypothetical protein
MFLNWNDPSCWYCGQRIPHDFLDEQKDIYGVPRPFHKGLVDCYEKYISFEREHPEVCRRIEASR